MRRRRPTPPEPIPQADDKRVRQIYCPYCQSPEIKILATTGHTTLCCCERCHAEFNILAPPHTP